MDITIHSSFLPHDDAFEVRTDVGPGGLRWITAVTDPDGNVLGLIRDR